MRYMFRREKQQYLFVAVIGASVMVTMLSFLTLYLPARSEYVQLAASIEKLGSEIKLRERSLERLEGRDVQLETARTERLRFMATRFIPREKGFAAMLPRLEELSNMAGIERNRVQFQVDQDPLFGVYAVRISMPVRGDYRAVMRFIRALESSDTLFILDAISMNRSESGTPGELDLLLRLTTFFAYDGQ